MKSPKLCFRNAPAIGSEMACCEFFATANLGKISIQSVRTKEGIERFIAMLSSLVTDYSKLYSVFLIMEKAELNFGITEEDEEKKHWSEAVLSSHPKVLEKMIERRQFDLARDYSDALGLATDEIAMKEVSCAP